MNTKLLYLTDMCTLRCDARITRVIQEGELSAVVIDQTVFYPQGGGQPSDKGTITHDTSTFTVEKVYQENDEVIHAGTFTAGNVFDEGNIVHLRVDPELRNLNSRNHTAGHVIDYAMYNLGYRLPQAKAYHFPQGPYVEYQGTLEQEERDQLVGKLEQEVNRLVAEALPVIITFIDNDPHKRAMIVQGYEPILCGGTHVTNTKDVGHVTIRKIKNEKGSLRVSYAV